jgi:large subunit ribosomal protein L15
MNLADVRGAYIPRKSKKRLGRGWGSGHGKTSGRGNKGQQARSGGGKGPGFEGGQMPLYRRLPKRGFNNHRFRVVYAIVNVGQLEGAFGEGATVDATAIRGAHLVNAKGDAPIKVLGGGDLSKKLHVTVDRFSESAKRKIEASGGSITALNPAPPPPPPKKPVPQKAAKAPKAETEEPAAAEPKAPKAPKAAKAETGDPAAAPKAQKPPKAKKPKGPESPEA